jgi:hypothetical protein
MNAREELTVYAASTRTVTADGLAPHLDRVETAAVAAFVDRVVDTLSGCCPECDACIDIMRAFAAEPRRPLRPDDVETGDGR